MNVKQPEATTSSKGTLLIVDDTQTNLTILTTILSKRGYQVQSVSDGITALQLIQSSPPDLVLLDILMPEITGYEVCKRLKSDRRTCHIPIIFISALEKGSDRVKAFSVGGADFISKPFHPQEVLARVEHQLQIIRLQRELNQQKAQLLEQNRQLQQENEERERALIERRQVEETLTRTTSRLSTLIANLQAGVLVEDEFRRIVLVNQAFCALFGQDISPDALIGADCSQLAEQSKALFTDPDRAVRRIQTILQKREVVVAEEVLLADGRILERDYIPIWSDHEYQGHLWQYRDITCRKVAEVELQYQLQRTLLLQQITEAVRLEIEPRHMFDTAVQQIGKAFQASRCIIYTYVSDPLPELAWVSEYINSECNSVWEVEVPVEGNPHSVQVLSQDEAIASPDVALDPLLEPSRFICHRMGLKSLLTVRTSYQGQPNGMIVLHQCDRFRDWAVDEIRLLEAIAAQVGIAFAQARLLEQEKTQREALDYQNAVLRQEICNRKRLEKELAQSQQFLHSIVDNIPLALFVKDVQNEYRYVLWNQAASAMYGLSPEEAVGLNTFDRFDPEIAKRFHTEDQKVVNSKQPLFIHEEEFQPDPNQPPIYQRLIKVPVADSQDTITHLLCIAEDISDRRRQEDEMRRAREAADAANQAKSEFLAHMSHELRTPLNTILGFTQLIARECTLDAQASGYLDIISRSGEHLLSLINDVLEMSKIEAGRTSLHLDRFDLYALLQSLEEMLRLKANSKGLRLKFYLAAELPQYVQADEGKLRQVLINLLGNAIKFTQRGQVILHVSVKDQSLQRNQPISPHPSPKFDWLQFEVEDTGPGIHPLEIDRLFRPFLQTEVGQKSQEGTGLGLPISQHFVRLMGGEITVDSVVGRGSIFRFAIQVQTVTTIGSASSSFHRNIIRVIPEQDPFRILVVEDHWANRQLLVKMLTNVGFKVAEAQNGQEAIALSASWQPHLIWMDIRMPLVDGYEATRQIKANQQAQAPIIIALTASAFEEDRTRVLEAGCDDFVRKPFRRDIILNKMADFLDVQYLYEEQPHASMNANSRSTLTLEEELIQTVIDPPLSLQIMPPTWIESLEQAAVIGSDTLLLQLIQQIPPNHSHLVNTLTQWIKNFDFDQVIELIERNRA